MAGPIRWFVHNPIAANLLMILLVVGGFLAIPALDKKYFPDFELSIVSVTMPYPGAGPSEVEQQICKRIEEAVLWKARRTFAPEFLTANRSPARPAANRWPSVAPYRTVLPMIVLSSAFSGLTCGGRTTIIPPDRPLPT